MADREKVIKSIEDCVFHNHDCVDCDYDGCVFKHGDCRWDLLADALTLLKEQEQAMKEKDGTISNLIAQIKEISQYISKYYERVVPCKDCDNRECDGRAGTIVCGITGESHSRLWFCADGERKEGR